VGCCPPEAAGARFRSRGGLRAKIQPQRPMLVGCKQDLGYGLRWSGDRLERGRPMPSRRTEGEMAVIAFVERLDQVETGGRECGSDLGM
jgi:hypothetical protein